MTEKIAVIGLGYVGLPVALSLARKFPGTIGFDKSQERVAELQRGEDRTEEADLETLKASSIVFSSNEHDLKEVTFFIIAVPTPIDDVKNPDLTILRHVSAMIGRVISKGAVAVFESTVYPGVTEDICGPIIAETSGLTQGKDFFLGYSPERINPGDKEHTLERIIKVVSGEDEVTLKRVSAVYGSIIEAGIHEAPSIMVAEAAKVIENTQRDLNIALMNELALIFERLGIRTQDVLEAAGTKWNFLKFSPGLVGGHCIGVDPYYLTMRAKQVGYYPQVILAGRRINDGMGAFIAQKAVKLLIKSDRAVRGARVGILGLTFKENVPDLRNSRVPDIWKELEEFGTDTLIADPLADPEEAWQEYGVTLVEESSLTDLDVLVLAVPHKAYTDRMPDLLNTMLRPGGVVIDIKSLLIPEQAQGYEYWSL